MQKMWGNIRDNDRRRLSEDRRNPGLPMPWCDSRPGSLVAETLGMTRDYVQDPLQVLSLGGGTQSTAMILMIQEGLLEKPDLVLFADTGSELPDTLEMIERCKAICQDLEIEFDVVRSPKKALHLQYLEDGSLPLIGFRTCTTEWKIRPIYRRIRQVVGMGRGNVLASSWIGITTDEDHRARESEHKWIERKYPLIDLNFSRDDCVKYCQDRGYDVKKSGCFMCPYQPIHQWERLQREWPEYFQEAIILEDKARANGFTGGLLRSRESIHRFNHTHTLEDFGFQIGSVQDDDEFNCDPGSACFL